MEDRKQKKKKPRLKAKWVSLTLLALFVVLGAIAGLTQQLWLCLPSSFVFLAFLISLVVLAAKSGESKRDRGHKTNEGAVSMSSPLHSHHSDTIASEDIELYRSFDSFIRDFYNELPFDDFVLTKDDLSVLKSKISNGILSKSDIEPIIKKMKEHMQQPDNYYSVEVICNNREKPNVAGSFSDAHKIVVNYSRGMRPETIVAILAHELSHCYQSYKHYSYCGSLDEKEKFTDFLTFFLGFGQYTINGKNYVLEEGGSRDTHVIGYLDKNGLEMANSLSRGRRFMKEMERDADEEMDENILAIERFMALLGQYVENIDQMIARLKNIKTIDDQGFVVIAKAIDRLPVLEEKIIDVPLPDLKKKKDYLKAKELKDKCKKSLNEAVELYTKLSELESRLEN